MATLGDAGLVKVCVTYPGDAGGLRVRVAIVTPADLAGLLARVDEVDHG